MAQLNIEIGLFSICDPELSEVSRTIHVLVFYVEMSIFKRFFRRTVIELLLQVIINFKEIFRILLKVRNISPLLLHGIGVFETVYGQRFSMIVRRRALVGGGHW